MKKTLIQIIILLVVGGIVLALGTYTKIFNKEETVDPNTPEKVMQIYAGTLPCADCEGIYSEISFVRVTSSDEIGGDFNLQEYYKGKSNKQVTTSGKWSAQLNSFGKTKITINSDKPKSEQRYFLLEPESILILDTEGKVIDSDLNYRLNRL